MAIWNDYNAKMRHQMQKEGGNYVTFEQLHDVLELIECGEWPDWHYGDDQCVVFGMIKRTVERVMDMEGYKLP